MPTKKFTREYLEELDLPYNSVHEEFVGETRWTLIHKIVFLDPEDGKHYATKYEAPATEYQECDPWFYNDVIEADEVELREVVVTKWQKV